MKVVSPSVESRITLIGKVQEVDEVVSTTTEKPTEVKPVNAPFLRITIRYTVKFLRPKNLNKVTSCS